MTVTPQDTEHREMMENFIRRTGWSFVLKDIATERWNRDVIVRIAERGTFAGIPVKGWTHTDTGTIFMREDILDGIDLSVTIYRAAVNIVMQKLIAGDPINREGVLQEIMWNYSVPSDSDAEVIWRIAQTVTAAYGVYGHEFCHAAYSEHAQRGAFQMGLEDLRGESLWMAQDPIRARQGLRACANAWVTHDASPMAGEQVFDLAKVRTHADLLHLYLLIGGRGRIGVLDDGSTLVTGIRELAEEVLGWETVSDADDIIDRFLETSEDPGDAEGAAQRAALAQEFGNLLPRSAGQPKGQIGCFCDPKQPQVKQPPIEGQQDQDTGKDADKDAGKDAGEGASGDQGGEDDQSGQGQEGAESGESGEAGESGQGEQGEQGSEPGDQPGQGGGEEQGEGEEQGQGGGQGDTDQTGTGEAGDSTSGTSDTGDAGEEGDQQGAGGKSGKDGDADDAGNAGDTGSSGGDEAGDGDDQELTVGKTGISDNHGDSDEGSHEDSSGPTFSTGTFGESIHPGAEDVTDEIDESGAFRLTADQVEALAEILTEGLEEVADDTSEAGWGISDEAGAILISRSVNPVKVASEVFSRQALVTRNRRIKR